MMNRRQLILGGPASLISQRAFAQGRSSGTSAADPFTGLVESSSFPAFRDTNAKTLSSQTLNGGIRNCILIIAGQSNCANCMPTAYTPTNATKVDNLNLYDGAVYKGVDSMLGTSFGLTGPVGCFAGRLADKLINANKFDRVILCTIAISGTAVADWATGILSNRLAVAIARSNARLGTPTAILWGQGETDCQNGTTQPAYSSALGTVITATRNAGYSGPWFVAEQTWIAGVTSAAVQAAQTGIVNHPSNIWAGPNADSLNATNRQADNTHFTDAGADAYAGLWQTALAGFGPPF